MAHPGIAEERLMFLGFLMIGMATGFMAGVAALIVGQGILVALMAYVLTGIATTLLGSLLSQLPAVSYGQDQRLTTST